MSSQTTHRMLHVPVVPYRPPTTESPAPNMVGPSLGQTPVVPETLSLGLWDLDAL